MLKFDYNGNTFVHFHPAKCGGTSIRLWCKKYLPDATNFVYKRHQPYSNRYNDAITFSVFRNPFDRLASLYEAAKESNIISRDMSILSFLQENFDKSIYNEKLKNKYKPFDLQVNYHGPGTVVFSYDNVNEEWASFAKMYFGSSKPLNHPGSSTDLVEIPSEAKDFILERWKKDFDYEDQFITERVL